VNQSLYKNGSSMMQIRSSCRVSAQSFVHKFFCSIVTVMDWLQNDDEDLLSLFLYIVCSRESVSARFEVNAYVDRIECLYLFCLPKPFNV